MTKFSNIVAFMCGLWLCLLITRCTNKAATEPTLRDTIVDTITVVKPIAVDSVITRYKVVEVERVNYVDSINTISEVVFDTIKVRLPIESKHYEGNNYEAWISGYEPSLDSINVYNRTILPKPKRWSIGVQGGLGITPKGVQPYIGVGFSYRLK